jgi:hypothetical protein
MGSVIPFYITLTSPALKEIQSVSCHLFRFADLQIRSHREKNTHKLILGQLEPGFEQLANDKQRYFGRIRLPYNIKGDSWSTNNPVVPTFSGCHINVSVSLSFM